MSETRGIRFRSRLPHEARQNARVLSFSVNDALRSSARSKTDRKSISRNSRAPSAMLSFQLIQHAASLCLGRLTGRYFAPDSVAHFQPEETIQRYGVEYATKQFARFFRRVLKRVNRHQNVSYRRRSPLRRRPFLQNRTGARRSSAHDFFGTLQSLFPVLRQVDV